MSALTFLENVYLEGLSVGLGKKFFAKLAGVILVFLQAQLPGMWRKGLYRGLGENPLGLIR